jgi:membrane-associated phospholipid phosphatase
MHAEAQPTNVRRRFVVALVVGITCSIAYLVVNAVTSTFAFHDVMTEWDRSIPFVPEWVWVYSLNIPMPLMLVVWIPRDEDLVKIVGGFLTILMIGLTVFILYPVSASALRPDVDSSTWSRAFTGFYYWFDGEANCLPSMHVAYSFFAGLWGLARFRRPWGIAYLGLGLAICVSTLLVKQHFIIDVVTGMVLGGTVVGLQLAGTRRFCRFLPTSLAPFISTSPSENG